MILLTALTILASFLGLTATLRFPETLLDPPSFGAALVHDRPLLIALSLAGLLASGVLIAVLARRGSRPWPGIVGGGSWAASAVLTALWAYAGAPVAAPAFVLAAIVAPIALAGWTIGLRKGRVLTVLGVLGLAAVAARSCVWMVNEALEPAEGLYLTSAILTTVALVGLPLWLAWLVGRALLAPVLAIAAIAVTFTAIPIPNGTGAPTVPSAISSVFYVVIEAFPQLIPMPQNLAELQVDRQHSRAERPEVPNGVTRQPIDVDGVKAERICASGATTERQILFLPGGGFTSIAGNGQRRFAAAISQRTKVCVLLTHYRLAPEHPYPAGRDDGVTAYRWLARQTKAENLAIMGDSAGGNLTLATALKLRADGDDLPASLTATSAPTDLALTGGTFDTLKDRDPLLTESHRKLVFDSYTNNGTLDVTDPLMSPLRADLTDLTGLPPTLLMVGTQEVLLSDNLAFGAKLRAAHVQVDLQAWPGQVHAWNLVLEEAPESTMTNDQIAAHILREWASVR